MVVFYQPAQSAQVNPRRHFATALDFVLTPFPNKPLFLRVCRANPLKTLWEKEKLPFSSNLNCRLHTLSVWKSLKRVVWGRNKRWFLPVSSTSL